MDETPTYALAEALWQSRQWYPKQHSLIALYVHPWSIEIVVILLEHMQDDKRWIICKIANNKRPGPDNSTLCAHAPELKLSLLFEHNTPTTTGWRPITYEEVGAL